MKKKRPEIRFIAARLYIVEHLTTMMREAGFTTAGFVST
jgi:hypothetical protein